MPGETKDIPPDRSCSSVIAACRMVHGHEHHDCGQGVGPSTQLLSKTRVPKERNYLDGKVNGKDGGIWSVRNIPIVYSVLPTDLMWAICRYDCRVVLDEPTSVHILGNISNELTRSYAT